MEGLFLSVLTMSLTASYVILCIIPVRLLLKKTSKFISYALWSAAAFRLLCPFSFESIVSLLPAGALQASQNIAYQQSPPLTAAESTVRPEIPYIPVSLPSPAVGSATPLYIRIGMYLWLLGIAVMLIYSVASVLSLKKRLKNARRIEANIYEADYLNTPFVLGIFRPKIYLPAGLGKEEQTYILRHEETHIRRLDHMIKPFAFFILTIHWFNPLVWIAFALMNTDMELSCDERVIKELGKDIKKAYSSSLLSLASGRHFINGSPLAFGEGNVKGRIKNVLNYRKPAFWVVTAVAVITAGIGIGLTTNPKAQQPGNGDEEEKKNIQIEIAEINQKRITGWVITDKDGYHASDPVSVSIGETVTYDTQALVPGQWIDIEYYKVGGRNTPEFTAYQISHISEYNTTFTLVEGKDAVRINTLYNPKVATALPSLILGGPSTGLESSIGSPDTYRYTKIEIGSLGDKVYYTYERNGKYYVKNNFADLEYEISNESYKELSGYVYKNEITHDSASQQTSLIPATPDWSPDQSIGADMAELDYASEDIVIFHGYFGLFVYDLNARQILRSLDLKPLNCHQTQGDDYCEVSVSRDGNTIQLHPVSSETMYIYTVSDHTLLETAYQRMEVPFDSFIPTPEFITSPGPGSLSYNAAKLDTDKYGYLRTSDWTLNTLSYVQGDRSYLLFQNQ